MTCPRFRFAHAAMWAAILFTLPINADALTPFENAVPIPAAGSVTAMMHADINRDGRPDLVIANPGTPSDELVWLENTLTGRVAHSIALVSNLSAVAAVDLDRDGDLDVVASSSGTNAIQWFANDNGDGSAWSSASTITNSAAGVTGIAIVDVDRDGRLDVIGALTGIGELRFWRQTASGAWQERLIGTGATDIREIAVSDIDSDGRPDVVGLVPGTGQIRWWRNPPDTSTAASWTDRFIGNAPGPVGLEVIDFDFDGAPDVLSASLDFGVIGLWINDGAGTGGAWQRNNLGGFAQAAALKVADLDRDGDLDVVLGSGGSAGEIAWLENRGTQGYALNTIEAPLAGTMLAVFDDNLDGDPDLFVGEAGLQYLENLSLGVDARFSFTNLVFIPLIPSNPFNISIGRINDDSRLDTLAIGVLQPDKSQAQALLNLEGDTLGFSILPQFESSTWPGPILPPRITPPAIADFDRDGRNDLLFGSRDNAADLTSMGVCSNSAAMFEDFPVWSCRELFAEDSSGNDLNVFIADAPISVDINRDGLLDFVAATQDWFPFGTGQRRLMWFEHLGDFSVAMPFRAHEIALGEFKVVDVADVTRDGRLDVITDSALFRNDVEDESAWTRRDPLPFGWRIVAAGDIDRDGVVDLAAVTGFEQGLHWLRRNGAVWDTFEIDASAKCPCALRDMDQDGDLDLLARGEDGEPVLYRNDLSRQTAMPWTRQTLFPTGWALPVDAMNVVDFSGDGKPELNVLSGGVQFIFTGLAATMTAAWRPQPPAVLVEGESRLVFEVEIGHGGQPDDPDIALTAMHFDVRTQINDTAPKLNAAELGQLVADLAVYRDDGDGVFDAGDTLLANSGGAPFLTDEILLEPGAIRPETRFACCDAPVKLFVILTPATGAAGAFPDSLYLRPARLEAVDVDRELAVSSQEPPLLRLAELNLRAPAPAGQEWLGVTVTGDGNVSSDPAQILCDADGGVDCAALFAAGSQVTLTASPENGQEFAGWEGDCIGLGACIVTMDQSRFVAGRFSPPTEKRNVLVSVGAGGTITSIPPRIDCPDLCEAEFDLGSEITLIATPAAGFEFDRWFPIFCPEPEQPTCSFTVGPADPQEVRVAFIAAPNLRTLDVFTTGQGRVISTPQGIDCGSTCSADFLTNDDVVLTATPEPGWRFDGWANSCDGTDPNCILTMNVDRFVQARFVAEPTFHRVTVFVVGNGRVWSTPAGIDCPPTCSLEFEEGTSLLLEQQAAPGFVFAGWISSESCGTVACGFTVNGSVDVEALFVSTAPQVALDVTVIGGGRVGSLPFGIDCPGDCSAEFDQNTMVELFALADPGFVFTGWGNACSGSGACNVVLDTPREVEAAFTAIAPRFELNVNRIGSGFVSSSPAGIDCGLQCLADFQASTGVDLFAAAAGGWRFSHFSGACSGGSCSVVMNADRQVTATFIEQLALSIEIEGQGAVSSDPAGIDCGTDCTAQFDRDTEVTLTAVPDPGWVLSAWIGASCPQAPTCTLALSQTRTVSARFEPAGDLLYRDGFE